MGKVPLRICLINKVCVECLPLIPPCPVFNHQGKTFLVSDHCLQHAFSLHHSLCSSLLQTYQGLFGYFTAITKDLPSSHRMELGTRCTLASTGVSVHVKRIQSKYSAQLAFCFKFISTEILKVRFRFFNAVIVSGFHCFFSALLLRCILRVCCYHFISSDLHVTT